MGIDLTEYEERILRAILKLGPAAYGTTIRRELDSTLGYLYIALDRLEQKDLIESVLEGATPERGGNKKRLVTITALGREALHKEARSEMDP